MKAPCSEANFEILPGMVEKNSMNTEELQIIT
ncbi:hypothetical protein U27_02235 [Candidatus Vecturithrix granuli]|uniref:Uncharacterized protein n=1 Tax=Vecturithrix granuli TaxID=1499967 RepID=A0A0S6WAS9_VECG1|nr:hypothetical protein U27_02235 [Candidatus Vecturithrix granuli]